VGLGEVVAKILATGSPCHRVVTESDAVSYPEIPHIDRLRALESYSAACNTQSCSVVSEDWSRRLGVAEVLQGLAGGHSGLPIKK